MCLGTSAEGVSSARAGVVKGARTKVTLESLTTKPSALARADGINVKGLVALEPVVKDVGARTLGYC